MDLKIQDIAREAGVSAATVSRVFNRHPNVRVSVRDAVLAVADRHGYRPRRTARKRNVILIAPSRRVHPVLIYSDIMIGELSNALERRKFRAEILSEDNVDQLFRSQFCAAVSLAYGSGLEGRWSEIHDAPLVNMNSSPGKGAGVFSVSSDEGQGMELAVGHLFERGHRRIGALIYGARNSNGRDKLREEGFVKAMRRRRLDSAPATRRYATDGDFVETVGKLLQTGVGAVVCAGEKGGNMMSYALGLYGRRVPADISLVSFERPTVSEYCLPPQTAISQDFAALAKRAVEIIEMRLDGLPAPKETLMPYKLLERDSVGEASGGQGRPEVS